jgi:hypothetical protein
MKAHKGKKKLKTLTTPRKVKISIPGVAYLDGRDFQAKPPLTVMTINLFSTYRHTRAIGRLKHGDKVRVEQAHYIAKEGKYWVKVSKDGASGWLSWMFLNTRRTEPVGDRV